MAKKRRSAKQRANDKRLGQMAKRRARKSTPKRSRRKSTTRKVNKPRKRRSNVVRRTASRAKRSIISKIPLVNNPTVKKVATGIGLATIGVAAINIIAPSIASNPIVRPALAFIGGGIPGLIGQVVVGGGLGGLSNIFGGGTAGGTAGGTPSSGFA